jgi:hypothetical protein
MKKYLLLLIFVVNFTCTAQQTIPMAMDYSNYLKNNNYIKDMDNDLDKFVGTWKWTSPTNPNTFFEINFFKKEYYNPSGKNKFYIDVVLGNYKYVDNGVEISNTLNRINPDNISSTLFPILIANTLKPYFKQLLINMTDIIKNKTCKANFDIIDLNATPLTATWKLISTDQIRIGVNLPHVQQGFSIPTDIVLIKQ